MIATHSLALPTLLRRWLSASDSDLLPQSSWGRMEVGVERESADCLFFLRRFLPLLVLARRGGCVGSRSAAAERNGSHRDSEPHGPPPQPSPKTTGEGMGTARTFMIFA